MLIREATTDDLQTVLAVERSAFGEDDEADVVAALLEDPTADPVLSLLAFEGDRAVGHLLFTAASLEPDPGAARIRLLGPLAVIPEAQRHGIGAALIEEGLARLRDAGVDLVFVLGHPGYYPRHGFEPAGRLGLDAPYPIPEKDAEAWMVQALRPGVLGKVQGTVACANAFDRPEYWRE